MHLGRHKRYPPAARSLRQQGSVSVAFTMDRLGNVVAARVLTSSGSTLLDEEATAVLKRASPLPAPPPSIGGATFELVLPIQFRIR
jgi:protein TonB